MSEIKITDIQNLNPAGSDFFADDESFITELSEDDLGVWGGTGGGISSVSLSGSLQSKLSFDSQASGSLSLGTIAG